MSAALPEECIFCAIVAGTTPATVVATSAEAVAFEDLAPGAPLHVLVVPRVHISGADAVGPADGAILGELIDLANTVARREGCGDRGYRLVMNVGPDAGQTVGHLHLHLLGGRKLEWPPG